jgi:hypothetical protein
MPAAISEAFAVDPFGPTPLLGSPLSTAPAPRPAPTLGGLIVAPVHPPALSSDDLLRHYVDAAPHTVASIDQLGNFLMGFGVLALGYLLQVDLSAATRVVHAASLAGAVAALALLAWSGAVLHLVLFVRAYVFEMLAGRACHVEGGNEDRLGEVTAPPEALTWRAFIRKQPTFEAFLREGYRAPDRATPEALLYARFTYLRFMALKKLEVMDRMRRLLGRGLALAAGFKGALVLLGALL